MKRARIEAIGMRILVISGIAVTLSVFVGIIAYILTKGIPEITPELFALKYTSDNCSLMPALINTITVTLSSLLIALPLGVFAAVYLVEYSKKGNKLVAAVRLTAETLSGIPSIIYGLFGYLMFVKFLGLGYSLIAGILTLTIMILPVIIRTTEVALMGVPDIYREGSFGLGAGRLRTVFKIVLPSAVPGILAGVILSIGRIVGETAALMFTSGTAAQIPENLSGAGRTLSLHLYALWSEGLNTGKAYATAVVILIIVVGINALSSLVASRISRKKGLNG